MLVAQGIARQHPQREPAANAARHAAGAAGADAADLGVLSDGLNRLALPRSAATPSTAHKSAFGRALTPPTATPAPAKVRIARDEACCVPPSRTVHVQKVGVPRHRARFRPLSVHGPLQIRWYAMNAVQP